MPDLNFAEALFLAGIHYSHGLTVTMTLCLAMLV